MLDWRGKEVETAESADGVVALANPFDNFIRPDGVPWPPPELVQKLYESRQLRAFRESDHKTLTQALNFYSDLQSLHSEDAITWSFFGPIVYATPEIRAKFALGLLRLIEVPSEPFSIANVWLWRRLLHPEKRVPGGPEIDFGLQTDEVFVIGEAKWLSSIGVGQGVGRNEDQITLRRKFCEEHAPRLLKPCRRFVVLGLSRLAGEIVQKSDDEVRGVAIHTRNTTWKDIAGLDVHPLASEIRAYLAWKESHSRTGLTRHPSV